MIYRGSNVDLDEFKNSTYATRVVDVFGKEFKEFAEWNWLKQEREMWMRLEDAVDVVPVGRSPCLIFEAAPVIKPAADAAKTFAQCKRPRIAPGPSLFLLSHGLSSGMLL